MDREYLQGISCAMIMAMSMRLKIALTIAVIASTVLYMIVTTVRSGSALVYFKHVDEVMQSPARWKDQPLKIHGNIVAGSILKKPASMEFKFALHRKKRWVEILYSGIVPDNFKDCAELVVEGKLVGQRRFIATSLSAKCPSKYDGKRDMGCGEELRSEVLASWR
jgi:cytochrome c-type biogenesis protein CcmE